MRLLLGAQGDLHAGVHGSLLDSPPPGVAYATREGRHHFVVSRDAPWTSPWRDLHLGEFVDFGRGTDVVHSARWPVLHRRGWVADLDDFGFPLTAGRAGVNPSWARARYRPWSARRRDAVINRAALQLAAWAHPSCVALLVRTAHARAEGIALCQQLGLDGIARFVFDKCRVMYPAVRAVPTQDVRAKWRDEVPRRVLFVGRDYSVKAGALALHIMRDLAERFPAVTFTYIGEAPAAAVARATHNRTNVIHLPRCARRDVLAHMAVSHVLLHPARRESVGMVLLEAMAAGCVPLVRESSALAHYDELLPTSALRIDAQGTERQVRVAWAAALTDMLANDAETRARGLAAHDWCSSGPLSIAARDHTLLECYGTAAASRADSLRLTTLLRNVPVAVHVVRDRALHLDGIAQRRAMGVRGHSFYL